ncbi:hypothetical protein ACIA5D_18420 [Actinoplanes sp. NPDC051513]|uniref:hypothetical protein n=1 Tax=Actinoplanes sp. NPDC051513 TaxID=3363908 RepID=UPI00378FADC5
MDRALLADFLRARREEVQPEDVGLPRGSRRRTGGLRPDPTGTAGEIVDALPAVSPEFLAESGSPSDEKLRRLIAI